MSFYYQDGQGSIADKQGKEAMDYHKRLILIPLLPC